MKIEDIKKLIEEDIEKWSKSVKDEKRWLDSHPDLSPETKYESERFIQTNRERAYALCLLLEEIACIELDEIHMRMYGYEDDRRD